MPSLSVPESNRLYMTLGNVAPLYVTLQMDGNAYNLTGATIWFTVKKYITDSDVGALIQKKVPSANITIADPTSGLVRINLVAADTVNLTNSWFYEYIWDLKVKDQNGYIITTTYGTLGVYPGVTNAQS